MRTLCRMADLELGKCSTPKVSPNGPPEPARESAKKRYGAPNADMTAIRMTICTTQPIAQTPIARHVLE